MLEKCQKSPIILQFHDGPMFLNPLIAVQNSLLVLREFLRDEAVTPYSGGVCPGS